MHAILLALAAAVGGDDEAARIAKDLIERARTSASLKAGFKARLRPPAGDAIDYDGECVRLRAGALLLRYDVSGGKAENLVRVGDRLWAWHGISGKWRTGKDLMIDHAARGLWNPDDVMDLLADHAGAAEFEAPGILTVRLEGPAVRRLAPGQGGVDWKASEAVVRLEARPDGRLGKLVCDAALAMKKGPAARLRGELSVRAYGGRAALDFRDEDGRPVPLGGAPRKAIESLRSASD